MNEILNQISMLFNRKKTIDSLLNMMSGTIIKKEISKIIFNEKLFNEIGNNYFTSGRANKLWNKSQINYFKLKNQQPNNPDNILIYKILGKIPLNVTQIKEKIGHLPLPFKVVNRYYDYTTIPNTWYVDFANEHLGGHIGQFVQEEKMFFIFPELMAITYLSRSNDPDYKEFEYIDKKDQPYNERTGAIVITNVLKSLKSEGTEKMDGYYGNLNKDACFEKEELKKECVDDEKCCYHNNIIAIDAYHVSPKNNVKDYNKQTLETYITKAYNGFKLANNISNTKPITIETGLWGSGMFGNHGPTMLAVQVIAARLSGVNVTLCIGSNNDIFTTTNDVNNTIPVLLEHLGWN